MEEVVVEAVIEEKVKVEVMVQEDLQINKNNLTKDKKLKIYYKGIKTKVNSVINRLLIMKKKLCWHNNPVKINNRYLMNYLK